MPSKPPSKLPFGTPAPAPAQKKKASPFGGAFALEGLGLEAKAGGRGAAAAGAAPRAPALAGRRAGACARGRLWRVWSARTRARPRPAPAAAQASRPRRRLALPRLRAARPRPRPRRRPSAAARRSARPRAAATRDQKSSRSTRNVTLRSSREVDKLLAKYAGKEAELVLRLQKKYAAQLGSPAAASPFGQTAAPAASPFGQTPAPAASPFGARAPAAAASPFGTTQTPRCCIAVRPDARARGLALRWQRARAGALWRQRVRESVDARRGRRLSGARLAFRRGAGLRKPRRGRRAGLRKRVGARDRLGLRDSGFGAAGGDARSKVVEIYQKCNPTKLGEVDKLLAKYAGREAELVARLQKKYAAQLGGGAGPPSASPRPSEAARPSAPRRRSAGAARRSAGRRRRQALASVAWRRRGGAHGGFGGGGGADGRLRPPAAQAPAFGSPAALGGGSAFGQAAASPAFGQASGFGGASPGGGFGGAAAAPSAGFGGFGAAAAQSPGFGQPQQPAFGGGGFGQPQGQQSSTFGRSFTQFRG